MAENTEIQWATHTFNPWSGCTKVSEGCKHCYAETNYSVKMRGVQWGPQGNRIVKAESGWKEPLKWDRDAAKAGVRHRVFCASLADVFEDWAGDMLDAKGEKLFGIGDGLWRTDKDVNRRAYPGFDGSDVFSITMKDVRQRLFWLIDETPNLDWLVLTKRPENIATMMPAYVTQYVPEAGEIQDGVRPNVWLGVSVENQKAADERIPILLKTPAMVRFLSVEPMLGPMDLQLGMSEGLPTELEPCRERADLLHWVICGGESGPDSRMFDIQWARSLRDQCKAAGVAFFLKQLGRRPVVDPANYADPRLVALDVTMLDRRKDFGHAGDMEEWPLDLRVREFPK